ncbi:MAG: MOSC domain-containing protein [Flavobacteriales bacterium]
MYGSWSRCVEVDMVAEVVAVCSSAAHTMTKHERARIRLTAGLGVEGDAHAGATVKHRSRVRQDPAQPNLRQVHLMRIELIEVLNAMGFDLAPGVMGENITTRGIDLLGLPRGTHLRIGEAMVAVTGLRNPCTQLDGLRPGLMAAVLDRAPDGSLIRKAGIMGIVLRGGTVKPGDRIEMELPVPPFVALERV